MDVILETHSLAIGYRSPRRDDVVVAHGLNLQLNRGQIVCLLGANGAGKSTLLRTLTGMQEPLEGEVILNGRSLHTMNAYERARAVSIVTTERPAVGMMTGWELVALGRYPYTDWSGRLSDVDRSMVDDALWAVGAEMLASSPVVEMSDGQRQKLMIARAVAQSSEMMLLDEPTAFLDLPRRVEVMRLLQTIAHQGGRAVLLSTHDFELALRLSDVIWLMGEGGSIQQGVPEDLALAEAYTGIFAGDDVYWDVVSGSFIVAQSSEGIVALIGGTAVQRLWTERALKRIGYEVGDRASDKISMAFEGGAFIWRFRGECHTQLGTLILAIQS